MATPPVTPVQEESPSPAAVQDPPRSPTTDPVKETKLSYWGRGNRPKDLDVVPPVALFGGSERPPLSSYASDTSPLGKSISDSRKLAKQSSIDHLFAASSKQSSSHFQDPQAFSFSRPAFSQGGITPKASVTFMDKLVENPNEKQTDGADPLHPEETGELKSCIKHTEPPKQSKGSKLLVPEKVGGDISIAHSSDEDEIGDAATVSTVQRYAGHSHNSFDRTPVQSFGFSQGSHLSRASFHPSFNASLNPSFNPSYNASMNPSFSLRAFSNANSLGSLGHHRPSRQNSRLRGGKRQSTQAARSLERDYARRSPNPRKEKKHVRKHHVENGGFVVIQKEGTGEGAEGGEGTGATLDPTYYQKVPSFRVYGTAMYNVNPKNYE